MKRVSVPAMAGWVFLVGSFVLVGSFILSGCSPTEQVVEKLPALTQEEEKAALRRPDPEGDYGQKLVAEAAISIAELVSNPSGHEGETVRIEGVIQEVCPMRGCWLDIADASGREMRVKVTDGRIVFPMSAEGHEASIEGTLLKVEYDAEQAMAYRAHAAEELGQAFDPETAEQGPMVIWQLDGKGAVIG